MHGGPEGGKHRCDYGGGKPYGYPLPGDIPSNFTISPRVDQLQVLQEASVFITHCGMNSVSESLYFGVPLVLFPQQPEEGAVARRVRELGAGIFLKSTRPAALKRTVTYLLENQSCRENAGKIGAGLEKGRRSPEGCGYH